MSKITFSTEQKAAIVAKIQGYFAEELDQDIGSSDRLETIGDAIYELEQPTSSV